MIYSAAKVAVPCTVHAQVRRCECTATKALWRAECGAELPTPFLWHTMAQWLVAGMGLSIRPTDMAWLIAAPCVTVGNVLVSN
jgi:hypothetical protein